MAVVRPSGSGKTELFFQVIECEFFYPKYGRVLFFYKNIQPIVQVNINAPSIQLEFVKFDGFDRLRNIENIPLVLENSCEKIYNDKELVKLATAGRHKGLDVIYVKHGLFLQADGHELMIWTHLTSFYSNHPVIFSNLIN